MRASTVGNHIQISLPPKARPFGRSEDKLDEDVPDTPRQLHRKSSSRVDFDLSMTMAKENLPPPPPPVVTPTAQDGVYLQHANSLPISSMEEMKVSESSLSTLGSSPPREQLSDSEASHSSHSTSRRQGGGWSDTDAGRRRSHPQQLLLPPRLPSRNGLREKLVRASSEPVMMSDRRARVELDLEYKAQECLQRGDTEGAVTIYDSLIKTLEAQFGRRHVRVGDAYYKLANVLLTSQEFGRAADCFQEAARVRRQVVGSNHLDVGVALAKLGTAKLHMGQLDGAHGAFREALWIARLHLGCDHVTVAQLQSQISCLYFSAGEYMAAEAGFEEALNIYYSLDRKGVDRHLWLVALSETFCNIGSAQAKRKQYSRAIGSFSEALNVQREVFDWNHVSVIATLDNLAFSQTKSKQYSRAQETYREMLRAQLSVHKVYNAQTLQTLKKLNLLCEKQGDIRGALDLTRDAYSLQSLTLDPSDDLVVETKRILDKLVKLSENQ